MFNSLGSWLGFENPTPTKTADAKENENESEEEKEKVVEAQNEVNKQQPAEDGEGQTEEDSFIFSFASTATKKISDSMVETANTIKKSVEEGKIIDKTFLGDFQKEQESLSRKIRSSSSPWVGYNEEETIQQQILALSAVSKCIAKIYPQLPLLYNAHLWNGFHSVKEDVFWRNYFYRVSLIKQSAQLTALAAQQQQQHQEGEELFMFQLADNVRPKTPPVSISDMKKPQHEDEEISTSPGVSEFVSDAFDSAAINSEDLRKGMEQLVLDKKDDTPSPDDWEKELQQELQEYEVVTESDNKDDQWDQEIEQMLQED
uniref:Synapse associated protein 1 n=1 Tax=Neogobius melanostomus TaxID=47308 RepID=A0A8C6S548_9GOBI